MAPALPTRGWQARARALCAACALLAPIPASLGDDPAAAAPKPTFDLAPIVLEGSAWSRPANDVMRDLERARFQWSSAERTSARSLVKGQVFLDMPVIESAFWTDGDAFAKAGFLLYSRGDTGGMKEEEFAKLIATTRETIQGAATTQPVEARERAAIDLRTMTWREPAATLTLEWSETREVKSRGIPYRAEFLRLIATPPEKELGIVEQAQLERDRQLASTKVEKSAQRRPNGDVVLEGIPMIDQGPKGYCVVASAERILRFYDRDVDQHELAQVANSSADEGTSTKAMLDALSDISRRMKFRVKTEFDMDYSSFMKMLDRYNRAARLNKVEPVDLGNEQMIDPGEVFAQMDGPTLRDTRTKPGADVGRFLRDIQRAIDAGQPLLWSVMLGLFPEPGIPQASGGHMRLVIGYNEKSSEILYSDSWGSGHEEKRMPLDDAWAITTGLHTMITR